MKPQTIEKLDLIAALRGAELEAEIKRHNATLRRIAHQREILAAYKTRLAESWKRGGVVTAGQALRAERFSDASRNAGGQIDQLETETTERLAEALKQRAALQAHRNSLAETQRKAEAAALRAAEQRAERLQPWRPTLSGSV